QAIAGASRMGYLTPRAVWESATLLAPVKAAARRAEVTLIPAVLEAPIQEPEYRRVFVAIAQDRRDGLIIGSSSENSAAARLIVGRAEKTRPPAVYPGRGSARPGG